MNRKIWIFILPLIIFLVSISLISNVIAPPPDRSCQYCTGETPATISWSWEGFNSDYLGPLVQDNYYGCAYHWENDYIVGSGFPQSAYALFDISSVDFYVAEGLEFEGEGDFPDYFEGDCCGLYGNNYDYYGEWIEGDCCSCDNTIDVENIKIEFEESYVEDTKSERHFDPNKNGMTPFDNYKFSVEMPECITPEDRNIVGWISVKTKGGADINRDGKVDSGSGSSSDYSAYNQALWDYYKKECTSGPYPGNSWCNNADINHNGELDDMELLFKTYEDECSEENGWCNILRLEKSTFSYDKTENDLNIYTATVDGWPKEDDLFIEGIVKNADIDILVQFIDDIILEIEVSEDNTEECTETAEKDFHLSSCVRLFGPINAEYNFAFMRGKSAGFQAYHVLEKGKDAFDEGFNVIDPYAKYNWDENNEKGYFAYKVDLENHDDSGLGDKSKWKQNLQFVNKIESSCGKSRIRFFYNNRAMVDPSLFDRPVERKNAYTQIGQTTVLCGTESIPLLMVHESGHTFSSLMDEYIYLIHIAETSDTNCKVPTGTYGIYGNEYMGCSHPFNFIRPTSMSLMNNFRETPSKDDDKFNIPSCAFTVKAIKGGKGSDYMDECSNLDTVKPDVEVCITDSDCSFDGSLGCRSCNNDKRCVDGKKDDPCAITNRKVSMYMGISEYGQCDANLKCEIDQKVCQLPNDCTKDGAFGCWDCVNKNANGFGTCKVKTNPNNIICRKYGFQKNGVPIKDKKGMPISEYGRCQIDGACQIDPEIECDNDAACRSRFDKCINGECKFLGLI